MTTPHQPTGMNELREIWKQARWGDFQRDDGSWGHGLANQSELEAAIQQIVERCLGQDEPESWIEGIIPKPPNREKVIIRNQLRADIRHNFQQAGLLRRG